MSTEDLTAIAENMSALLNRFVHGGSMTGLYLPTEHQAEFQGIALEAKSMIDEALRPANDYSMRLLRVLDAPTFGMLDGPSYSGVKEACEIVRSAVRTIERRRASQPVSPPAAKPYVDAVRIAALSALRSRDWDFTRLAELCREINVAAANRCHMSTAMLLRTILDHVPPVLGFTSFAEVASNYGGPKDQRSFKKAMQRLHESLRVIADMHLHSPIRPQVDVPTVVQVDFAAELDVLLGEVIRVARQQTQ